MATITASLVKELRERTGVGMMECKKALEEAKGDIEQAIEIMRKSGQAKAAKKASRIAAEGIVIVKTAVDQKSAIILEINCETDFVARDVNFMQFADQVASVALQGKCGCIDKLGTLILEGDTSVEHARQQLIIKIGENISLRRVQIISTEHRVGSYVHGGRIGVLVEVTGDEALAKDLAMQIAASNPVAISADQVSKELVQKEREIAIAQSQSSGKPANIIEKMVEGRVKKYLDEVTLLGQPFVKDPNMTVAALLQQSKASVNSFVRYEVGEGIEKVEEDFVEAVMAQARGA